MINRVLKRGIVLRSGVDFAEKQLHKGLTLFSDIFPIDTMNNFKAGVHQPIVANNLDVAIDDDDVNDGDVGGEDASLYDRVSADEDDETTDEVLSYSVLKEIGLGSMSSTVIDDCRSGNNSLILPHQISQCTLNGRNGSNACTVISLIAGCIVDQNDHISYQESVPVYVGCIDAGNSFHEGPELLLLQEAIDIVQFDVEIAEERDCFMKDLKETITLLFEQSKTIILTCRNLTVCLVQLSSKKVFLFDSHQHDDMGALIAWTKNDIIIHIPCHGPEDIVYLASIRST